jgi:hypothetical protein
MLSAPNNLRGGRSTNFAPDERDARCGQRLISGAFRTHGTEVAQPVRSKWQRWRIRRQHYRQNFANPIVWRMQHVTT